VADVRVESRDGIYRIFRIPEGRVRVVYEVTGNTRLEPPTPECSEFAQRQNGSFPMRLKILSAVRGWFAIALDKSHESRGAPYSLKVHQLALGLRVAGRQHSLRAQQGNSRPGPTEGGGPKLI